MVSENDRERERYPARVTMHRDELGRLYSTREEGGEQERKEAREAGRWEGIIVVYQRFLKRPVTSPERLQLMSLFELQQLAQQLQEELDALLPSSEQPDRPYFRPARTQASENGPC